MACFTRNKLKTNLTELTFLLGVREGLKKMCKITHLFLTHQPTPQLRKKQKKHVVFLGFSAHLEPKNFLKFFHLENFSTSSICGLILIIEGHGGSLECKRG